MGSYLKDKKIELWREDRSQKDKDGFPVVKKTMIAKVWAYYRHISAKEYYAAMAVQEKYEAVFVINYRAGIDPRSDYIIFRGRQYDIVAVDDFTGNKSDIKITAQLCR